MCETWVAIVRRDSNSVAAISGFDNPASTSAAILVSVGVRLSHPPPCNRATSAAAPSEPIDLHCLGERGPGLLTVAGADELPGGRLQRLGLEQRPTGLLVTIGRGQQLGGIVVQQAAAVPGIRLPVRDLRIGGQRRGLAGEGSRGANVADLHGETHGVGEQVLDLIEFLAVVGKPGGQRGKRVGQRVRMLVVEAAGERQRADDPVPDLPDVCLGGSEVTARRGEIAAMEADHGGDAEVAARRGGLLQVIVEDVGVGQ